MTAHADRYKGARPFHAVGNELEILKHEIEQSITSRFEKIVRTYPDRLAVKSGNRSVTYDQLNRFANRIARAILAASGPGSKPIALLFENGIDIVGAIIGVLKAGKFFVTLDPSWPENRIRFILNDCEAQLMVTNSVVLGSLEPTIAVNKSVLNIDEIDESHRADDLNLPQPPEDIASILYTSGSTGEPKGVIDNHLVNMHHALLDDVSFQDRISLVHSIAFGSGRAEVFLSLLNGAALFPFDLKSEGLHRLAEWLNEEQITICHLPPMAFHKLTEIYISSGQVPRMRKLRLSGAPVARVEFDLYNKVFSATTGLQINMGSTETRRICGAIVDHDFPFPAEGAPVGYPAPWKDVVLLDEHGRGVEPGEVGEIAVRSRYLCIGYWRNPQLTQAKFVHGSGADGERTFLTGDMGRFLPDGFLIHLGRKDLMVKIRGYRVEVSEVEKALRQHPEVEEAGVTAWSREADEKYLAAYIVCRDQARITVDELRKFLRTELPDYMIPTVFMFITSLPITNGKLDRKALPEPTGTRPILKEEFVPARNEIESDLVQIWETVLAVHPIGIRDNFFDLGGHSLAATRIVSQVLKRFQFEVPIQSLFQSPTVAQMSSTLQEHEAKTIQEENLKNVLDELESLSNEEVQQILDSKNLSRAK